MIKKNIFLPAAFFCIILSFAAAYDLCGDKICGETETTFSCKEDCPSGSFDYYCDKKKDGRCDRDCISRDNDCQGYSIARDLIAKSKSNEAPGWRFFLGAAAFFAMFFLAIHMIK